MRHNAAKRPRGFTLMPIRFLGCSQTRVAGTFLPYADQDMAAVEPHRSGTTTILSILAVLGAVGALGAVWGRLGKRRHRRLAPSDAGRAQALGVLDSYSNVRAPAASERRQARRRKRTLPTSCRWETPRRACCRRRRSPLGGQPRSRWQATLRGVEIRSHVVVTWLPFRTHQDISCFFDFYLVILLNLDEAVTKQ